MSVNEWLSHHIGRAVSANRKLPFGTEPSGTRPHAKRSAMSASILVISLALTVTNPLSASAATHYYRYNANLAFNVWALDTYGYSHANAAEPEAGGSAVQVSNGVFTATGIGYVQQTYAQAEVYAKCRWTTPSAWPSQRVTCWDSY